MNVQPPCDGLWQKRLNALSKVWPDFVAGNVEALHKTRVATRRIREALPVAGANASPAKVKKLRRRMRDLTRFLGPIRELDVELGLIEQHELAGDIPGSALGLVRREIAARRQALREKLKDDKPVGDLRKLVKKLEKVASSTDDRAWHSALAATLLRRAKRMKQALDDAGPLYAPERIHDVRIAIKKLRYALEMADETGAPGAKPLLKVLKREQALLGQLHDREALLKHVRHAEASSRMGARLEDLSAYAKSLERECRHLHARFVESRDALFACVTDVRQRLVPAVTTRHFHQARVTETRRSRPRAAKGA